MNPGKVDFFAGFEKRQDLGNRTEPCQIPASFVDTQHKGLEPNKEKKGKEKERKYLGFMSSQIALGLAAPIFPGVSI